MSAGRLAAPRPLARGSGGIPEGRQLLPGCPRLPQQQLPQLQPPPAAETPSTETPGSGRRKRTVDSLKTSLTGCKISKREKKTLIHALISKICILFPYLLPLPPLPLLPLCCSEPLAPLCGLLLWYSISSTVHTAPLTFSTRMKHLWRDKLWRTAFCEKRKTIKKNLKKM